MLNGTPRIRRDRIALGARSDSPDMLAFRCGDTHWRAAPDVVDELFGDDGLQLDQWRQGGQTEIVKDGPHRTVTRVQLPLGCFYVKHYRCCDWKSILRSLVRPCTSVREWSAARRVDQLGIATIEIAAIGRKFSGSIVTDNYLVTREIADSEPVIDFIQRHAGHLPPSQVADFRRQLAARLGELTARQHCGDLLHHDYHAGNILLHVDADGKLRLWLIDLAAVASHRRIGLGQIERNLSLLAISLGWHATRSDRLRFARAYWKQMHRPTNTAAGIGRRLKAVPFEQFVRRVENHSQRAIRRAIEQADRKWKRANRRLKIADSADRTCRGLSSLGAELIESIRDKPEQLFAGTDVSTPCRKPGVRIAEMVLSIGSRPLACTAAAYDRSATGENRAPRVCHPSMQQMWECGHALLRRGIHTPRPLMFVETESCGYLLCESIEPSCSLGDSLRTTPGSPTAAPRDNRIAESEIIRSLADQLHTLHDHRFEHGDLSADNIRIITNFDSCQVYFTGTEHIRRRRFLRRRHVVSQLAGLSDQVAAAGDVRMTQRLRFLKRYLRHRFAGEWKRLWKQVARRTTATAVRRISLGRVAKAAALLIALLVGGCRTVDKPITLPARHSVRSDQLLVLSDFKLSKDHPLIENLEVLRREVAKTLDVPLAHREVVVYLFSDETEYRQYLSVAYPGLPDRRAYFVGTPRELAVYTFWGDRIAEDLRHEYTHGLLHSCLQDIPLWLDEGLAEYFEVLGPTAGTINPEYADRLTTALGNEWRPDLKRLERLDDFAQMQRVDYQEAWAWVHFLLNGSPDTRQLMQKHLQQYRSGDKHESLSTMLQRELPDYEERLIAYIGTLKTHLAAAASP